jgi:hypothetical protein
VTFSFLKSQLNKNKSLNGPEDNLLNAVSSLVVGGKGLQRHWP